MSEQEPEDDPRSPMRSVAPRRWVAQELPVSGIWAERRRLAAALRRVIEHLTVADTPEDELRRAADRMEEYAAHLATHPRRPYLGFAETALAQALAGGEEAPREGEDMGGGHFDYSPLIGRSNPLSPPIRCWSEGRHAIAEVVFGSAYEGPPGHVHGGYVAAAFDEVLGYAQALTGQPGMTGTLVVRYRRPTPLDTELRFDCWVERVEGRKNFARGTLHAGERLCAESEAIFIAVGAEKMAGLAEARRKLGGG